MRAAIYARYSSDLQRESSIEDQFEICRRYAESQGWTILREYSDRAASGSTKFRPEYQDLLATARRCEFDVVLAEALDRLSRDQEDVAALFKTLTFHGVQIVTLAEGLITELHVGLKGTMNALFLKDLSAKTHRGMRGRIKEKRAAGGLSYGYEVKRETDAKGEPVRGGQIINPDEAAIVRRIFAEFAGGASPRAIAKTAEPRGDPGARRQAVAGYDDPRTCRAGNRDPAQRALRRTSRLEPAAIRKGSVDRQTPGTPQPARRMDRRGGSRASDY